MGTTLVSHDCESDTTEFRLAQFTQVPMCSRLDEMDIERFLHRFNYSKLRLTSICGHFHQVYHADEGCHVKGPVETNVCRGSEYVACTAILNGRGVIHIFGRFGWYDSRLFSLARCVFALPSVRRSLPVVRS